MTSWILSHETLVFETVGRIDWTWPTDWEWVEVEGIGSGGSGGGSATTTQGGAGASGCWARFRCQRPASGVSEVLIGAGGAAVVAGNAVEGNQGCESDFNQQWFFRGGLGGQQSDSIGAGGDGGAGGVVLGAAVDEWIQGGQGGASSPGNWYPCGAAAPRGGIGGNNHQGGSSPGGGGAPGDAEFDSGAGGNARFTVRRLVPITV